MKYDIAKIRKLIARTGLTEKEFLHSVGLGAKTMERWQDGTELPREDYVQYIAEKLETDSSALLLANGEEWHLDVNNNIGEVLVNNYATGELFSREQTSPKLFRQWVLLIGLLYDCCSDQVNFYIAEGDFEKDNRDQSYSYLKGLVALVGEVNGYEVSVDHALFELSVAYAWIARKAGKRAKQIDDFRANVEHHIARKIIELQVLPPNVIDDAINDRRLARKLKSYRRKKEQRKAKNENDAIGCKDSGVVPAKTAPINAERDVLKPVLRVPNSTIMVAFIYALDCSHLIETIVIVADQAEQKSQDRIYWVGRDLSAAILSAIQTTDCRFKHKGTIYQIADFQTYRETEKYLKIISRFCDPSAPQTVYVFAQKNIAHFSQDNYETVTAMVPCADRPYPIPVTVYYDKNAHQYFINEATYTKLRQSYGLPYLRLRPALGPSGFKDFSGLRKESELHLLGYNVSTTDGLTSQSRRKLLTDAIDSGVLWKSEVMNHLEWLIHTREGIPNMENAVGEWRSDLRYISDYKATEQRKIWIDKFKSRFSKDSPSK